MTPDLTLASQRALPRSRRERICLFLVAVLLPFFFVAEPVWLGLSWLPGIANFGHIFFFASLTLLVHSRYPLTGPRQWWEMTGMVLIVSLFIELIQGQIGRTASVADVLRNLLGTWTVIAWQLSHRPIRFYGRALVSVLLIIEVFLIAQGGLHRYRTFQQFPILNTLEAVADMKQWRAVNGRLSRALIPGRQGEYALSIELLPGDFAGAIFTGFPSDWSDYSQLHLDLHNPQGEAVSITLRIHDRQHQQGPAAWRYEDRFNRSFLLEPGWNHLSIRLEDVAKAPAGRLLDLEQINELRLFVADSKKPQVIHVDNLRLGSE